MGENSLNSVLQLRSLPVAVLVIVRFLFGYTYAYVDYMYLHTTGIRETPDSVLEQDGPWLPRVSPSSLHLWPWPGTDPREPGHPVRGEGRMCSSLPAPPTLRNLVPLGCVNRSRASLAGDTLELGAEWGGHLVRAQRIHKASMGGRSPR